MSKETLTIEQKIALQEKVLQILSQERFIGSVESQSATETSIRACLSKIQQLINLETTGEKY